MYMYDSEKISNMIKTLEEHSYSYTHYKHQNGEGCINTEILLKQLKLNETEIRAKAIDEFADQMKRLNEEGEISVAGWNRIVDNIAEKMKAGGMNE